MIDPLLNIPLPQPGHKSTPHAAIPGTSSFQHWMQSGQGDAGSQAGTASVLERNAVPGTPGPLSQGGFLPVMAGPQHVVEDQLPDPVVGDPFIVSASFEVVQSRTLGVPSGMTTSLTPGPAEVSDAMLGYVGTMNPLLDSNDVINNATCWRDFAVSTIELHVKNQQGVREVVAMPWRLMANGHLAQSNGMDGIASGQAVATPSSHVTAGKHTVLATPSNALYSTLHSQSFQVFDGKGLLVGTSVPSSRYRTQEDAATLHAMSSHAPAAAEWLARWMKWIERDGRDVVVLLRDFSVDEDQAARVVDGLRSFARSQGVNLERIVMNGHELWRNPQVSNSSKSKE